MLSGLGSGKTLSSLWSYDYLRSIGERKRVLVVSTLSTLDRAWGDTIFEHFPHLTFSVLHGSKEKRLKLLNQLVDIYIINHDGLKVIGEAFGERPDIDMVIVDEVSEAARNAQTDRWKSLNEVVNKQPARLKLPPRYCIGLTATPVPNDPTDAWAQCRLITPDTLQATAAAQLLSEEGIDHLVVLHRGDSYGLGLAEPLREQFEGYGGQVTLLAYDPDLSDFAAEVDELAREVRRLDGNVAVMIISFQPDGLNILGHARLNGTLNDVRWFGSKDALSPVFFPPIAPEEVSQFMVDMNLTGFFPTPPDNPVRQAFERNYEERFGTPPTPWALYMYDAVWVSALTTMVAGEYTGPNLRAALPQVTAHYIGASGHKLLNDDGDSALGVYELMVAREVDGALVPLTVGLWDSGTGVITRFE